MPYITAEQLELFILIILRVSAIVGTMPIIGSSTVPLKVKGGISIILASLLLPFVDYHSGSPGVLSLSYKMCGEIFIGIIIGLMGRLLLAGVQLAGQLIGFQMGFAIVNVVDPVTSSHVSIISQFQYLLAMLAFLAVNAHHIFLYSIAESYHMIPPLSFHFNGPLMEAIINLSKDIFTVAIKTGAPVIAILLFTSVGMGLIARTVPQINVFIVGFPMKIAIGLIGIGLTLPFFMKILGTIFLNSDGQLKTLMSLMY